ncbi:MAG: hypothetical protein NVSMB65_11530 [Chloroflexota bacterium]
MPLVPPLLEKITSSVPAPAAPSAPASTFAAPPAAATPSSDVVEKVKALDGLGWPDNEVAAAAGVTPEQLAAIRNVSPPF